MAKGTKFEDFLQGLMSPLQGELVTGNPMAEKVHSTFGSIGYTNISHFTEHGDKIRSIIKVLQDSFRTPFMKDVSALYSGGILPENLENSFNDIVGHLVVTSLTPLIQEVKAYVNGVQELEEDLKRFLVAPPSLTSVKMTASFSCTIFTTSEAHFRLEVRSMCDNGYLCFTTRDTIMRMSIK